MSAENLIIDDSEQAPFYENNTKTAVSDVKLFVPDIMKLCEEIFHIKS